MLPSLKLRFIAASLVLLPALLGISAYSLDLAFRRSLLSGENERIKSHVYLLLGAAEIIDGELWMPEQLAEPKFSQTESGLYGFIIGTKQQILWQSPSAQLFTLPAYLELAQPIQPGSTAFLQTTANDKPYFVYSHDVIWDGPKNDSFVFRVAIFHAKDAYFAELNAYRTHLWRWLGLLALSIVISQMLILHWGLKPLKLIARDLARIKSGDTKTLTGNYPDEITPITNNLNQLLASEQQQRERYRNTMDDLAHSLKTPLAVIKNALQESSNQQASSMTSVIDEQIDRMNQIVSHQLRRATNSTSTLQQTSTPIKTIAERIGTSLAKVYADKAVSMTVSIDPALKFMGDERDIFELLGNLLDNAFKYCQHQVAISGAIDGEFLRLTIEDDGPGIPEHQQPIILQRGSRADTAMPGQGIGLAVCVDIASSYRGGIEIGRAALGGAQFILSLPYQRNL